MEKAWKSGTLDHIIVFKEVDTYNRMKEKKRLRGTRNKQQNQRTEEQWAPERTADWKKKEGRVGPGT
jgi:hypothetical protein